MNDVAKLLTSKEVETYQLAWQKALPNELPNLFFGFTGQENERVVSYCLQGKFLNHLLKMAEKVEAKKGSYQLVVKLGLREKRNEHQPGFVIMLQLHTADVNFKQNTFLLDWVPNPSLPGSSTSSGVDAIPAEGAYLFVLNWLETAYAQLADPFEATAAQIGKRVKAYLFSTDESKDIIKGLAKASSGKKGKSKKTKEAACLSVHLGKGMTVNTHPFGFRPVIEVGTGQFKTRMMRPEDGGDNNAFFDFSRPCPPYCGGD